MKRGPGKLASEALVGCRLWRNLVDPPNLPAAGATSLHGGPRVSSMDATAFGTPAAVGAREKGSSLSPLKGDPAAGRAGVAALPQNVLETPFRNWLKESCLSCPC